MKRAALALATALCLTTAVPAAAGIDTTTTGAVQVHNGTCAEHCDLYNFGGYRLRGRTEPSREGQIVVFHYRRADSEDWKRFKVADPDAGATEPGFNVQNRSAPRDRINAEGRWSTLFTPNVRPGDYELRVRFRAQDGFERSRTIEHVTVHPGD